MAVYLVTLTVRIPVVAASEDEAIEFVNNNEDCCLEGFDRLAGDLHDDEPGSNLSAKKLTEDSEEYGYFKDHVPYGELDGTSIEELVTGHFEVEGGSDEDEDPQGLWGPPESAED